MNIIQSKKPTFVIVSVKDGEMFGTGRGMGDGTWTKGTTKANKYSRREHAETHLSEMRDQGYHGDIKVAELAFIVDEESND